MPFLLKLLRYFLIGNAQRVVGLQLAVAATLCLGGYFVWRACENEIRSQHVYWIKIENIRVFNPPVWISNAFIQEALEYRSPERRAEPLNSLDPNLKAELLAAFNSHPWVDKVEKIVVYYPARIDLYVKFKEPVAVVDPTRAIAGDFAELGDETASNEASDADFTRSTRVKDVEKYVVDANGYRLPGDYFNEHPNAYSDFINILGVHSTPVSNFGQCVDPFVVEAAAFVDFLVQNDATKRLGINRVFVSKNDGATKGRYTLKSKDNRTTVFWGYFTPASSSDEATTEFALTSDKMETPSESFEDQQEKFRYLLETAKREGWLDAASNGPKRECDISDFKSNQATTENPPNGEKTPTKQAKEPRQEKSDARSDSASR